MLCDRCKKEYDEEYYQDEDTNSQRDDEKLCPDCLMDNEEALIEIEECGHRT